jgi:peptidoglycan/xylan/chitin deacetylase (PgdA/CDA1 family)
MRQIEVPILMYHHVAIAPAGANRVERDLSVSPDSFIQQLTLLKQSGYETISLRDLVYHLNLGRPLPPKPVIITFDDGYVDNGTTALPLLQEFGFSATFFIITDYVDRGLSRYMTWEQIAGLAAAGMEIGSHSRDHPDMRNKKVDYLVWQILGSQQTLEAHVGGPIYAFSYPSGAFDARAIDVLRSAHFWCAVTASQGAIHTTAGAFELARIRVRAGDTLAQFQRKLMLDW